MINMKKRIPFILILAVFVLVGFFIFQTYYAFDGKTSEELPAKPLSSPAPTEVALPEVEAPAIQPKSDLRLEGLESPWAASTGNRQVKFLTEQKFDKLKLILKRPEEPDKEFITTQTELTLEPPPAGVYQVQAFAYVNDEVVTESEATQLEVIHTEDTAPEVDTKVKEVELYF